MRIIDRTGEKETIRNVSQVIDTKDEYLLISSANRIERRIKKEYVIAGFVIEKKRKETEGEGH